MSNNHFEKEASYTPYRELVDQGMLGQAMNSCLDQLTQYKANHTDYAAQHKGSPFYVMGYCAFALHDYSGAGLFFDAALSEDHRYHPKGQETSAKRLMRLETLPSEALATQIIEEVRDTVVELLNAYNARTGHKPLSLADMRKGFLGKITDSPRRTRRALVTSLISFVGEWKYRSRLLELAGQGSPEVFYLHLFRGCVLFESLLKENTKRKITQTKVTMGSALKTLQPHLGLTLGIERKISATDLDEALREVKSAKSAEECVIAAGKLRNTLGHKISWPSTLTPKRYDQAVSVLATACFHAISHLYA